MSYLIFQKNPSFIEKIQGKSADFTRWRLQRFPETSQERRQVFERLQ